MNVVKKNLARQNPRQLTSTKENFKGLSAIILIFLFLSIVEERSLWIHLERVEVVYMLCIGVSVSWFHHTLTMNHILLFFDRKLIPNFCLGSFIDPVFLYTKYCCGTLICHFDISSCDFIHKVIFSMQNMGILFVASSRSKKDQAPTTHILSVTLLSQL